MLLLAINALILFASVRFVRSRAMRGESDGFQVALDAMLLWYLVQYVAVGLPGTLGVLSGASMLIVGGACAVILFLLSPRNTGYQPVRTTNPTSIPFYDEDPR